MRFIRRHKILASVACGVLAVLLIIVGIGTGERPTGSAAATSTAMFTTSTAMFTTDTAASPTSAPASATTATRPPASSVADAAMLSASSSSASSPSGSMLAPPPSGVVVDNPAQANHALAMLGTLPVKGRAPRTGYARTEFGPSWTDDVSVAGGHNGCDTRNDVLRRDLSDVVIKPGSNGCTVLSGTLHDPYTGASMAFVRGVSTSAAVQIDHVVSLGNAWVTGAQYLSLAARTQIANDPINLQATIGEINNAKGDGDAATWLPPQKSFRCTYVARQVAVKSKYGLWVTNAERNAIEDLLRGCGATVTLPPSVTTAESPAGTPSVVTAASSSTAPAPKQTVAQGCHPLTRAGNCYQPGQVCAKEYRGTTGVDGNGTSIECVDKGKNWQWVRI